jgi:hypothetical protein
MPGNITRSVSRGLTQLASIWWGNHDPHDNTHTRIRGRGHWPARQPRRIRRSRTPWQSRAMTLPKIFLRECLPLRPLLKQVGDDV